MKRIQRGQIRWLKRARGWAGFIGNKVVARIEQSRNSREVYLVDQPDERRWRRPYSVVSAMDWALAQLRDIHAPQRHPQFKMCLVGKDGQVFHTRVPRQLPPAWAVPNMPAPLPLTYTSMDKSCAITTQYFTCRKWRNEIRDLRAGIFEDREVFIYVEDGADDDLVRRVANAEMAGRPGCEAVPTPLDPIHNFDDYKWMCANDISREQVKAKLPFRRPCRFCREESNEPTLTPRRAGPPGEALWLR